jgi:uncharacterized protein
MYFTVSLARRLQDPLTEYVRVPPQHLGIGQYQHDAPLKKLEDASHEIVSECVSFVGVDLNTCPVHVLRYLLRFHQLYNFPQFYNYLNSLYIYCDSAKLQV